MSTKKHCNLEENMKIRNKLLNLGIGYTTVGPKGPKGEKGDQGPQGDQGPKGDPGNPNPSSNEGMIFASFQDTQQTETMTVEDTWIVPSTTEYFKIKNQNEIEIVPGIYEITFSGHIKEVDTTHEAELYIKTEEGSSIKDLHYKLESGDLSQMQFSQSILFRFEKTTTLQVETNITGNQATSNIKVENTTLIIKKIHE